jgi:GntR family transcriptional regulator
VNDLTQGPGPDDRIAAALAAYLRAADDSRPLYRKVADGLAQAMTRHSLSDATHLPGERQLSETLGISRATLRKAMAELVATGLLVRRHGARTEVSRRLEKTLSTLAGFSDELLARGVQPGQRWLSRRIVAPTPSEAMALGLTGAEAVVRLERVRLADGTPIALERAVVPAALLPSAELVETSLYATLAGLGAAPVRGIQRIRAGVMSRIEAELLQRRPGDPILIVERRCFLADGRPVEFTETRYDGESYDFLTELRA